VQSGRLSHEVYVWQRSWSAPVREAVSEHGAAFSEIVALAAEVSWNHGKPQVVRCRWTLARLGLST